MLTKVCRKKEKLEKLIIAGDFNVKTPLRYHKCYYDGTYVLHDDNCNGNGARLKTFCMSNLMCILLALFVKEYICINSWIRGRKMLRSIFSDCATFAIMTSFIRKHYITVIRKTLEKNLMSTAEECIFWIFCLCVLLWIRFMKYYEQRKWK